MRKFSVSAIVSVCLFVLVPALRAHCEVPCGIYDDPMRIELMMEHTRTIEKSMKKIKKLRGEEEKNYNQLVRWINNKEQHAQKLQKIVWQYFMTQRIKPAPEGSEKREKYVRETTLLHQMLVQAMKCKQTTNLEHVENLRQLTAEFKKSYLGETKKKSHGKHKGKHHH